MDLNEVFVDCPISDVQPIVRGKWTAVIIYFLSRGTHRFGKLRRKLPIITALEVFARKYQNTKKPDGGY